MTAKQTEVWSEYFACSTHTGLAFRLHTFRVAGLTPAERVNRHRTLSVTYQAFTAEREIAFQVGAYNRHTQQVCLRYVW